MMSIIVPIFNGSNYIEKCLNSIKLQSFTNFEIIITDNFSTDDSIKKIENFIDNNKNLKIHLLKNSSNIGLVGNINRGLSEISINSKYLYIICVDDWIEPNFIENSIKILEANIDCSLLSSSTKLESEGVFTKFIGNAIPPGVYSGSYIIGWWFFYTFFYGINLFSYPVGIVIRRNSDNMLLSFDESLGSPSDVDFFIRIIMNTNIIFTNFLGAHVLDHAEQQNKSYKKSGELLINQRKLIEKHEKFLHEIHLLSCIQFITLSSSFIRFVKFHDNPARYKLSNILISGSFATLIRVMLKFTNFLFKPFFYK